MVDLINQNAEGFLLLFIVCGVIGVGIVMFLSSPWAFIKAVLKDLLEYLSENDITKHDGKDK